MYAVPLTERAVTSGFVVFLNGSLINWSSRRQRLVAHSTMESEYISAANAAREALWWRTLLKEIGAPCSDATTLCIDNQAAIRLAVNPLLHEKSKHIELRHHAIRQLVGLGIVKLVYVPTAAQLADGMTKSLSGPKMTTFCASLRLTKT